MKTEILKVAGLYESGQNIDALFKHVDTRIVDLATGEYVDGIDATTYDQRGSRRPRPQAQHHACAGR